MAISFGWKDVSPPVSKKCDWRLSNSYCSRSAVLCAQKTHVGQQKTWVERQYRRGGQAHHKPALAEEA